MTRYKGIDVSNWSGTIDWERVADTDVEVVIIQASEGTFYRDPYLHEFYDGARANGLKLGFYHFFNPGSSPTPVEQARYFIDTIKGLDSDCKLVLDLEQTGGLGNYELTKQAIEFLREVESYSGLETAVYTYTNFVQNNLYKGLGLSDYALWVAQSGEDSPSTNHIWGYKHAGWQYLDIGNISGISANTNLDIFYDEIFLDEKKTIQGERKEDSNHSKVIYYTVRSGDTLSVIAKRYDTTVLELQRINGISDINLIYPGEILKIYPHEDHKKREKKNFSSTYIVRKGDTLTAIAIRFGTTVNELMELNNITNPSLIYPGEILKIPTVKNKKSKSVSSKQYIKTYIVQSGDTLSGIAKKFNTTVDKLLKINHISNQNLIYLGEVIKIECSMIHETKDEYTKLYIVQQGDTLSSISKKLNKRIEYIEKLNDLPNHDVIYANQVLKV